MTLNIWFWLIYVLALLFGLYGEYLPGQPYPFRRGMGVFVEYILIGLLGWQVFGSAVR